MKSTKTKLLMEEMGRIGGGDKRPGEVLKGKKALYWRLVQFHLLGATALAASFRGHQRQPRPRRARPPLPRPPAVAPPMALNLVLPY